MFSIIDAAIIAGLAVELGLAALLAARGKWRTRWGKVVILLCCAALVATLVPAARQANAHWRLHDVRTFVRMSIERLNTGQMPDLSTKCTDEVVAEIEALKGIGLPTDYAVEDVEFAGDHYALILRTSQGESFWCMVEATVSSARLFAPGKYKFLTLSPPQSVAANQGEGDDQP